MRELSFMPKDLSCPEFNCAGKLEYEPGEEDQHAGPPSAWVQGHTAVIYCNSCAWETTDVMKYLVFKEA